MQRNPFRMSIQDLDIGQLKRKKQSLADKSVCTIGGISLKTDGTNRNALNNFATTNWTDSQPSREREEFTKQVDQIALIIFY